MIWEVPPVLIHMGNHSYAFLQQMRTDGDLQVILGLPIVHLCQF